MPLTNDMIMDEEGQDRRLKIKNVDLTKDIS